MLVRGRGCSKMPCESCAVQFSVFRRKRACSECERYYCSACLRRGGGTMCAPCRALSTRPLQRVAIVHLKVRDLQCFLQRQNVSTRGCVEKEELVTLCVAHVNSAAYRRRAPRAPFPSLKGFTNNINDFLNSAFDLRAPPHPQHPAPPPHPPHPARPDPRAYPPQPQPDGSRVSVLTIHLTTEAAGPVRHRVGCVHAARAHEARPERFTATPGGEERITVPIPSPTGTEASADGARVDTADCFEVEDLDDAGWEFVRRPADPLPTDSEVLLAASDGSLPATPVRASSSLELRSASSRAASAEPDSASLQDEPALPPRPAPEPPPAASDASFFDSNTTGSPQIVSLEQLQEEGELEALSARQLKELLARNRVEFRGCVERAELLARARTLYRDHARHRDELEALPLEECCKICMAAPLECVLLECGHIAACTRCAKQLAECPICRQYVVRAVRCFRS